MRLGRTPPMEPCDAQEANTHNDRTFLPRSKWLGLCVFVCVFTLQEITMPVVALRLLALGVFAGLYMLNPFAGIAALAAGWGYVAWQYRSRRGAPADGDTINLRKANRFTLL